MSDLSPDDHDAFMQAAAAIELCAEDRIEEMQQWIVSHPAEVLALLEEGGVLAKRFAAPNSRYADPNLDTWRLFDDPSHVYPEDDVTEVWTRIDTLPPLIGEEDIDDGE